jgi:hypothetical protein
MPATTQTIKDAPGDPAFLFTCDGEEKMPLPITSPMTSDSPFRYVRLLFLSNEPPLSALVGSSAGFDGAPNAVYPCAVLDRGKRFGAKSNAEDTLYERLCRGLLGSWPAGFSSLNGSSSSKESLRDEGAPETEDSSEVRREGCEEEAREASSSESRVGGGRLA